LLDGRGFYSAAVSGTTPGLLFNEHVERIRALGSRCMERIPQGLRAAGAIAVGLVGMITAAAVFFLAGAARALNGNWGTMDARWTA